MKAIIAISLLLVSSLTWVNVPQGAILPGSVILPKIDGSDWREWWVNFKLAFIADHKALSWYSKRGN